MTRATAEVVGVIEGCMPSGEVRIANLVFHLPEGESASIGQFVRANLVWVPDSSGGVWVAKDASVFEAPAESVRDTPAPPAAQTPTREQGTSPGHPQSRFGQSAPTSPAAAARPPAAAPAAQSRFGASASKPSTPVVVPLRNAPPAQNGAQPVASQPARNVNATQATQASQSRFGSSVHRSAAAAAPRTGTAVRQISRPPFTPAGEDDDIPF
jgi:hypothetical protein